MATITLQIEEAQASRFLGLLQTDLESISKKVFGMEIELQSLKEKQKALREQIAKLKPHAQAPGPSPSGEEDVGGRMKLSVLKIKIRNALYNHTDGLGVTEIANVVGAQPSSIYRALGELEKEGSVENADRKWKTKRRQG